MPVPPPPPPKPLGRKQSLRKPPPPPPPNMKKTARKVIKKAKVPPPPPPPGRKTRPMIPPRKSFVDIIDEAINKPPRKSFVAQQDNVLSEEHRMLHMLQESISTEERQDEKDNETEAGVKSIQEMNLEDLASNNPTTNTLAIRIESQTWIPEKQKSAIDINVKQQEIMPASPLSDEGIKHQEIELRSFELVEQEILSKKKVADETKVSLLKKKQETIVSPSPLPELEDESRINVMVAKTEKESVKMQQESVIVVKEIETKDPTGESFELERQSPAVKEQETLSESPPSTEETKVTALKLKAENESVKPQEINREQSIVSPSLLSETLENKPVVVEKIENESVKINLEQESVVSVEKIETKNAIRPTAELFELERQSLAVKEQEILSESPQSTKETKLTLLKLKAENEQEINREQELKEITLENKSVVVEKIENESSKLEQEEEIENKNAIRPTAESFELERQSLAVKEQEILAKSPPSTKETKVTLLKLKAENEQEINQEQSIVSPTPLPELKEITLENKSVVVEKIEIKSVKLEQEEEIETKNAIRPTAESFELERQSEILSESTQSTEVIPLDINREQSIASPSPEESKIKEIGLENKSESVKMKPKPTSDSFKLEMKTLGVKEESTNSGETEMKTAIRKRFSVLLDPEIDVSESITSPEESRTEDPPDPIEQLLIDHTRSMDEKRRFIPQGEHNSATDDIVNELQEFDRTKMQQSPRRMSVQPTIVPSTRIHHEIKPIQDEIPHKLHTNESFKMKLESLMGEKPIEEENSDAAVRHKKLETNESFKMKLSSLMGGKSAVKESISPIGHQLQTNESFKMQLSSVFKGVKEQEPPIVKEPVDHTKQEEELKEMRRELKLARAEAKENLKLYQELKREWEKGAADDLRLREMEKQVEIAQFQQRTALALIVHVIGKNRMGQLLKENPTRDQLVAAVMSEPKRRKQSPAVQLEKYLNNQSK